MPVLPDEDCGFGGLVKLIFNGAGEFDIVLVPVVEENHVAVGEPSDAVRIGEVIWVVFRMLIDKSELIPFSSPSPENLAGVPVDFCDLREMSVRKKEIAVRVGFDAVGVGVIERSGKRVLVGVGD